MLTFAPGRQVVAEFSVPDANGDNVAGLTWTLRLFKDGAEVTSGTEFDSLSIDGIGSPPTGYAMSFTPITDGSTYMVRGKSSQGDVWEERLEPQTLVAEGAPSYDQRSAYFRLGSRLVSDGKLVNCTSATAVLYRSDDQTTPVKNLGSGTEGALNTFTWGASGVTITGGRNYVARITFTIASVGSPAAAVTVVRDLSFLA